jgi:hypothetical protein
MMVTEGDGIEITVTGELLERTHFVATIVDGRLWALWHDFEESLEGKAVARLLVFVPHSRICGIR